MTHTTDEWSGCYPSKWKGLILDESMVHPAKFSFGLIQRIYSHMKKEGWLKAGDYVIDPFAGIALGAFHAMSHGLNWVGNELEPRFVQLGRANIEFWQKRYDWWKGTATLLQGDSRHLLEILEKARLDATAGAVASPAYSETRLGPSGIDTEKSKHRFGPSSQVFRKEDGYHGIDVSSYQGAVSSSPFSDSLSRDRVDPESRTSLARERGISNAENVSPIDMEKEGKRQQSYSGAISSPVYSDGCQHTGGDTPTSQEHIEGGEVHLPGIRGVVSSSPYSEARIGQESGQEHCGRGDQYGDENAQLGAMKATEEGFQAAISSSPYADSVNSEQSHIDWEKAGRPDRLTTTGKGIQGANQHQMKYGDENAQLGAMKATEEGFQASVASPPFGQENTGGGIADGLRGESDYPPPNNHTGSNQGYQATVSSPPFRQASGGTGAQGGTIDPALMKRHAAGNSAAEGYGATEGNIANLPEGDFDGAVSSPPFKDQFSSHDNFVASHDSTKLMDTNSCAYGSTAGQLASADDFWTAARLIVEQTYLALIPGGHAVWVCKDFVKDKKRVPFSDQWRQLCEAVGFVTLHEHHALLVRNHGSAITLEKEKIDLSKESKSFFRRLGEKKVAEKNYWNSLTAREWKPFMNRAVKEIWDKYNALSEEEKTAVLDDGVTLKEPPPTPAQVLRYAQKIAFVASGEDPKDWNADIRIDWETVWCMEKPK